MAGQERVNHNNYPPIPLLSLALQRIHDVDPSAVPKARTLAKNMNAQVIENYSIYNFADVAKIPYSHVSTDNLPRGIFGEKALGEEHSFVFFPGVGGNLTDQINTAFALMTERASQSKTQPVPSANFYFIGHPTGPGGEISEQWIDGLNNKGLTQHHDAHTALLRHILPQDTKGKHITYHGTSMGTYAATHASKTLTEWHGRNANFLQNPPGSYNKGETNLGERLQLMVGYGIENALRRTGQFLQNEKDLSQRDREFHTTIAPILDQKGISLEDNKLQKDLKRRARLKELLLLAKKPPLPKTNTPTTIEQGVWDLISFSPMDALRYMKGKTVTIYENVTHKLTPHNHSPQPYPDQMVYYIVESLKAV